MRRGRPRSREERDEDVDQRARKKAPRREQMSGRAPQRSSTAHLPAQGKQGISNSIERGPVKDEQFLTTSRLDEQLELLEVENTYGTTD